LLTLSLGDFDAANQDANAAIELAPQRPEGYFLLGNVAEQVGDLRLALDSFQQEAAFGGIDGTGHVAGYRTCAYRQCSPTAYSKSAAIEPGHHGEIHLCSLPDPSISEDAF
jgi:tetratricopeptide (TPR) repeat protein